MRQFLLQGYTFYAGIKMRYFITIFIFCSFILEIGSPRKNKGLWPPLIEKMRMLDDKSSEYIDTDLLIDKWAKSDPRFSTKTTSSVLKTSPIESMRKASVPPEGVSILPTTEKHPKNSSNFEVDGELNSTNYVPKFKANGSSDRTKPNIETVNWNFSLRTSKIVKDGKELLRNRSKTFYSDEVRANSNKLAEDTRRNVVTNDYKNRRFFKIITQQSATTALQSNSTLQYKQNNHFQSNDEVLEEDTHVSSSTMTSSKDFLNSLSYTTTASNINYSSELFNKSLKNLSNEIWNSSLTIQLDSAPKSRLSKTVVAAIVAGINGIIGFTGAAIFTCTKPNYLRSGERLPLIR